MQILRFIAILLILGTGTLVVSSFAQDSEKSTLTRFVEGQLSSPNRQIRLNGLEGILSSDVRLESITIADNQGVWLTIVNPRLIWSRTALLRGRVDIESLTADRIILPRKPLPGRRNIVITRRADFVAESAELVHSVDEALAVCAGEAEVSIIGGGQVYAEAMSRTDRIYLTRIHLEVDGDTFLPELKASEWHEVERRRFARGERDDAEFTLIVMDRMTS